MTRLTLCTFLCACSANVTTYQGDQSETALGGSGGQGGTVDAGSGPCVTVQCLVPDNEWTECGCGEVCCDFGASQDCAQPDQCKPLEPDCEGDAMCWPWGFCDAGWCQAVDGGVE